MLTIGQQLYDLTERDLSGLFVDPFFRTQTVSVAAAAAGGSATFNLELDKSLFLHNISITLNNAALSTWYGMAIDVYNAQANVFRIFSANGDSGSTLNGDYQAGGAGRGIAITRTFNLIIPPNSSSIVVAANRATTTNPVDFRVDIVGYKIPPGRIGRLS